MSYSLLLRSDVGECGVIEEIDGIKLAVCCRQSVDHPLVYRPPLSLIVHHSILGVTPT